MRRTSSLAALLGVLFMGGAAHANCVVQAVADLPITMVGLKPVMPAKINGQDVRFIADSGAFFSVISPASAAALSLHPGPAPFGLYMTGVGGTADISLAKVKSFGLANSSLDNVDFIVGGSDIGRGEAIGVIGENVLGLGDAEYDLAGGMIRLMQPKGCGGRNLAYWSGDKPVGVLDIQPREPARQPFIVGVVLVNGVRVQAMFDTGADTTVLSIGAARRAGIRTDGPGVRFAGYSGGFGRRSVKTWIAPVDSFDLGGEAVKHTELRVGELGPDTEMLVGADFFLSHRVFVANSQHRLYFTYNGGPVFNLSSQPATPSADPAPPGVGSAASSPALAAADEPKDADGYSRRGAALAARHDYERALADFTKAIGMAPSEPRYLYQRAALRLAQKQPFLAMADLDGALKLSPDDAEMHLVRARLRLTGHDRQGALADVDAAAAAAPKPSDLRLRMAMLYDQLDAFGPAIQQYDLWTRDHQDDNRLPSALNGRCWARAMSNQELGQALADCNTAVRLTRGSADVLDSRGMVHLRRGENDAAIADYDAALQVKPKLAWSLYGRGLAEERMGDRAKGEADLAAAVAIEPKLAARAAKLGLAPPDGPATAPVASR